MLFRPRHWQRLVKQIKDTICIEAAKGGKAKRQRGKKRDKNEAKDKRMSDKGKKSGRAAATAATDNDDDDEDNPLLAITGAGRARSRCHPPWLCPLPAGWAARQRSSWLASSQEKSSLAVALLGAGSRPSASLPCRRLSPCSLAGQALAAGGRSLAAGHKAPRGKASG